MIITNDLLFAHFLFSCIFIISINFYSQLIDSNLIKINQIIVNAIITPPILYVIVITPLGGCI